jgi:hypothetical protein
MKWAVVYTKCFRKVGCPVKLDVFLYDFPAISQVLSKRYKNSDSAGTGIA